MSPAQGSYFGLSLPPSKDMAEPATPFFTPSAFPATPNPHHQQQQHTNTSNSNAGFFAALQRRNAAESPTSADATPKRPAFQLAQTPSAVDPCSSSSGATPFFSDLSIHQNSQSHKPAPSNGTHHNSLNSGGGDSSQHPSSTLLRRTSSASALPAPQPNTPFNKSFMSVHYNGNANKRPSTASSASPSSAASFPSVAPADLQPEWFLDQRASTLVLDLRTHSNYMNHSSGRFRGSINLCVPTTLLRRPNHNLSKLADTVPEQHHREALLDVLNPATCIQRVIAVDQDSVVLAPSGPLYSILSKVSRERENAQGSRLDLFWLKGGMGAAAKEERLREANVLVWPGTDEESDSHSSSEASLPSLARTDSDTSDRSTSATSIQSSDSNKSVGSASTTLPPILQVRSLPMAAFDNTSTQQYRNSGQSSSGAKPHGALSLQKGRRMAANPFFDAIRQNREVVDLETSIKNVQPLSLSPKIEKSAEHLPGFLRSLVDLPPKQRAERLAAEFHELETLEQRRLSELMEWHSAPQRHGVTPADNPLSISAGVEKGHLNRYKHIFPFEHSRCRLQNHSHGESDYINASHIHFRAFDKQYIASQGPLAAATNDFWQLVWQENVAVVVMLTHLCEGGLEKCHKYFESGTYGSLKLTRIDKPDSDDQKKEANAGPVQPQSFFSAFDLSRSSGTPLPPETSALQRTFRLEKASSAKDSHFASHQQHPSFSSSPRNVQHFQFGNWPDFDIPPDADTLISFMQDVNKANEQTSAENGWSQPGPILVHCSAGVGRTGCYMLIDTLLDFLEPTSSKRASVSSSDTFGLNTKTDPSAMALDEPSHVSFKALHPSLDSRPTPPLLRPAPVFAAVNEMREQRMSMVANLAQYQFIHTAVMHGLSKSLSTPTLEPQKLNSPPLNHLNHH